jgi:hypothetical protein
VKPSKFIYQLIALVVASNYFAFQVELFEEEYEENHREYTGESSFSSSTLNWESFDKDAASKAFVIQPTTAIELLFSLPQETTNIPAPYRCLFDIRDKSPPAIS